MVIEPHNELTDGDNLEIPSPGTTACKWAHVGNSSILEVLWVTLDNMMKLRRTNSPLTSVSKASFTTCDFRWTGEDVLHRSACILMAARRIVSNLASKMMSVSFGSGQFRSSSCSCWSAACKAESWMLWCIKLDTLFSQRLLLKSMSTVCRRFPGISFNCSP